MSGGSPIYWAHTDLIYKNKIDIFFMDSKPLSWEKIVWEDRETKIVSAW